MIDKKPMTIRNIDQDHKEGEHGISAIQFVEDQFETHWLKKKDYFIVEVTSWIGERIRTRIPAREFVATLFKQSNNEDKRTIWAYIENYVYNHHEDFGIEEMMDDD